jgi:uncharacterized membrane protein
MPILILGYPLLAHLAAIRGDKQLQWLALVCLSAVLVYPGLRELRWGAWLVFLALSALLYGLSYLGGGQYALFIPPVLLPLVISLTFGESLLPGRTPLITRIARAARGGALPPELAPYTRRVTLLWTAVLFAIAATAALLALLAPLPLWSTFTNLVSYLIVGALFPLEYAWRRWRYSHLEHPGFWAYVKMIARLNYRKL